MLNDKAITPQVLIAGGGPTGLVLALWLTKSGVRVRIIDKAETAGTTSRAIVIHARSLEFYRQLGVDQIVLDEAIKFSEADLWVAGKKEGHINLGNAGEGLSLYNYILIFPQDKNEGLLVEQLASLGVVVERNTALVGWREIPDGIIATLQKPDGSSEECTASYLAGCDGGRSVVRKQLGFDFPGGTYEHFFYVADIQISGALANGSLNMALDDADFLAFFPMKGKGNVRIIGTILPEAVNKEKLVWGDVSQSVLRRLPITVDHVNWFSTYKVHHRVASHFRKGKVFLLGDAGHLHSPVGGQGMNTGIGDAVNLAWKLAAVIKNNAPVKLLDTYEPERIRFAQQLVKTTDSAFTFVNNKGALAKFVRLRIAPKLMPFLLKIKFLRRKVFGILSQIQIHYPKSPLSSGSANGVNGGDRLPWVPIAQTDNYKPLETITWQVHVYGTSSDELAKVCNTRKIQLAVFQWQVAMETHGLVQNTVYIIRPDGHIGSIWGMKNIDSILRYFTEWGIGTE